jgi:pSer/pThr/pTyr-binding forkhead associated (FHA) protein/tetratricopeptide (TPR) repeat protein
VQPIFRLVHKAEPNRVYETRLETFQVGRSDECEIKIDDPQISKIQARVSRIQSKVWMQDDIYMIENKGKTPILINGLPTDGQYLNAGDIITLGNTEVVFDPQPQNDDDIVGAASESTSPAIGAIEKTTAANMASEDKTVLRASTDDKTVVIASPVKKTIGPRLVLASSYGKNEVYPIIADSLTVGRGSEAGVQLNDPAISRLHCTIQKQANHYIVRNLSQTNPLLLNDERVAEKRLYSGDKLRIGNFSLIFVSDRPEDAKPVEEKIITRFKGPRWILLAASACLVLILGVYLIYLHVYHPWKIERTLESISAQIASGDYMPAQDSIKQLLKTDLTPEETQTATQMLVKTILIISKNTAQAGRLEDAKKILVDNLADYGAGEEAEVLWNQLDLYRVQLGQRFEARTEYQAALNQYAAVREDGPYFSEAQKAIKRIWLTYQQRQRQHQTLSQLIEEAEAHYRAKRYLTPMNQNAYATYQAILAMDPQNSLALQRIEQIKDFYQSIGTKHFKQKNWAKALVYFERYRLIDPENPEIQELIRTCKQNLMTAKKQVPKTKPRKKAKTQAKAAPSEEASDEQRDKIKRALEESGTDSSWIMKYLFEEESGEKDSEKPW